jgi:hypothetical protein
LIHVCRFTAILPIRVDGMRLNNDTVQAVRLAPRVR